MPLPGRGEPFPGSDRAWGQGEGVSELRGTVDRAGGAEVQRGGAALPEGHRGRVPSPRALPETGRGLPAGQSTRRRGEGLQPGPLLEPQLRRLRRLSAQARDPEAPGRPRPAPQSPDQHHAREGASPEEEAPAPLVVRLPVDQPAIPRVPLAPAYTAKPCRAVYRRVEPDQPPHIAFALMT